MPAAVRVAVVAEAFDRTRSRATVHYANRDYGTARRVMHRITLRGEESVGVGVLR